MEKAPIRDVGPQVIQAFAKNSLLRSWRWRNRDLDRVRYREIPRFERPCGATAHRQQYRSQIFFNMDTKGFTLVLGTLP